MTGFNLERNEVPTDRRHRGQIFNLSFGPSPVTGKAVSKKVRAVTLAKLSSERVELRLIMNGSNPPRPARRDFQEVSPSFRR